MRLIRFEKNEIEKFKKSDIVKYGIVALATPSGLFLSCVLAYLNIDFIKLLEIFIEHISNPKILDELTQIMSKWYIISGFIFLVALLLPVLMICFVRSKKNKHDTVTWMESIFLTIELILMSQAILPFFTILLSLIIPLFYFLFFSSIILKDIFGYGTYLFVLIIEKISTSTGITLSYSEFIGQERYSIFLTIITFLISIPYLLSFLLRMIKKILQYVTRNEIVGLLFKPIEVLFSVNILRYIIYILLFFISIFTYSINISQSDYTLSLLKEALLEFVLLDTVIYSISSNLKDKKIKYDQQNIKRHYMPFKYDLEFVLSAITIQNLKNKEISARIKFSEDIDRILNMKKLKDKKEINMLLKDISENYYKIDILEHKIKVVLSKITNLIG